MARVPWVFDGYEWPINPQEDSGWKKDRVAPEQNNIGSRISVFQLNAEKSARRQINGFIWGPLGGQLMANLIQWRDTSKRATLRDHTGMEKNCFLFALEFKAVKDAAEWRQGRQTYTYTAEFVETT